MPNLPPVSVFLFLLVLVLFLSLSPSRVLPFHLLPIWFALLSWRSAPLSLPKALSVLPFPMNSLGEFDVTHPVKYHDYRNVSFFHHFLIFSLTFLFISTFFTFSHFVFILFSFIFHYDSNFIFFFLFLFFSSF